MHPSLARALEDHRAGRLDDAARAYRALLEADPRNADVLQLLGLVAHQTGAGDEAVSLLKAALAVAPAHEQARFNLAAICEARADYTEAIDAYKRVLATKPRRSDAWIGLGNCFRALGRSEDALASFDRALTIDPDSASGLAGRSAALADLGRLEEAAATLRRSGDEARAHILTGQTLAARREFERAGLEFAAAVASDPTSADARANAGAHAYVMGSTDEAIADARRAIGLAPNDARAHFNLAVSLLRAGAYEEGWREFEWRRRDPRRAHDFRYRSSPGQLAGELRARRLFVSYEQGFGDLIFLARYLPALRQFGAEILVETPRELLGLIGRIEGVRPVEFAAEPFALEPNDACVPAFSLPALFVTNDRTIPGDVPYLRADAQRALQWKERLRIEGDTLNVAIVWAGGSAHALDFVRSARLSDFAPLASVPGVRWFSLQIGPATAQITEGDFPAPLTSLGGEVADFDDTAAILEMLDLVIAVDTSVVHLAGALARPVWTLLGLGTDWRWGTARLDTPWYPTMRLFRQNAPDRWDGAIAAARTALAAMASRAR